jgi:RNA polymerase sigma-70 factor (ECF subfamily)
MTIRDFTFPVLRTRAVDEADIDLSLQMDEDAFRGFYDRTSRPLWVYLHRLTGSRATADDLLQDSYYRLLRADAVFESETHRRRYLFRIATNLVRDGARRQRVRPALVPQDDGHEPETADANVSLARRLDLAGALRQLVKRERALLWLAYAQGSTHEEIAAIVGVKTSSVKPLLFRARRRLAGLLGRDGGRS